MVRGRSEAPDVGGMLTRVDESLGDLRSSLTAQDRGIVALRTELDEIRRGENELRSLLETMGGSVNAETRTLREQISDQSHRLDEIDAKLGQIETLENSLMSMVDDRLRNLNLQVTTAIAAMVVVVAIGMILLLLLR